MINKSIIIAGIDPGIADTGYGVIKCEGSKISCLEYGSIKTPAHTDLADRLESLHLGLTEIIKRFRPNAMAVEILFFNKNVRTALVVGQARGVVMLDAKLNQVPIIEFTPSQVKQAVAAYGQATKSQIQKMVKIILGLKEIPKPDDAADALALAIAASAFSAKIFSNKK